MKNLKDAILDNLKNNFSVNHTEKDAQTEINKYYESIKYLFNDDEVYAMYKAITDEGIKEIQDELDEQFFKNNIINLSLNNIEFINDEFINIKYNNKNFSRLIRIFKLKNIDVNLCIESDFDINKKDRLKNYTDTLTIIYNNKDDFFNRINLNKVLFNDITINIDNNFYDYSYELKKELTDVLKNKD